MYYRFRCKQPDGRWTTGWAESLDQQVVAASPAFAWARGKRVSALLDWLIYRGFSVQVSGTEASDSTTYLGE